MWGPGGSLPEEKMDKGSWWDHFWKVVVVMGSWWGSHLEGVDGDGILVGHLGKDVVLGSPLEHSVGYRKELGSLPEGDEGYGVVVGSQLGGDDGDGIVVGSQVEGADGCRIVVGSLWMDLMEMGSLWDHSGWIRWM